MAKKKTDSAVARVNRSARTPEEEIPIGIRSARQSLQHLDKLKWQPKERLKESLNGPGLLRR